MAAAERPGDFVLFSKKNQWPRGFGGGYLPASRAQTSSAELSRAQPSSSRAPAELQPLYFLCKSFVNQFFRRFTAVRKKNPRSFSARKSREHQVPVRGSDALDDMVSRGLMPRFFFLRKEGAELRYAANVQKTRSFWHETPANHIISQHRKWDRRFEDGQWC